MTNFRIIENGAVVMVSPTGRYVKVQTVEVVVWLAGLGYKLP